MSGPRLRATIAKDEEASKEKGLIPMFSVIVPTYDSPRELDLVPCGLSRQTRVPDEVLIADDGSDEKTADVIASWKQDLGCKVYAFCLMTNHVHLLVDPGESQENLALLMKRVAGKYTRFVNREESRSGTVWDGRYKSSPIETDRYLLACSRYIELNPVRAGIVAAPQQYRWSS